MIRCSGLSFDLFYGFTVKQKREFFEIREQLRKEISNEPMTGRRSR